MNTAASVYQRTRRRAVRAGMWLPRASTDEVRAHIEVLRGRQVSLREISRRSGVPYPTVSQVAAGRFKTAYGHTIYAILAVAVPSREGI